MRVSSKKNDNTIRVIGENETESLIREFLSDSSWYNCSFCLFVFVFSCFVIQNIYFFNDRILGYSSTNARCYIHKIAPTNFLKQGWNCSNSFSMMYMTVKDWQVCFRFVSFCSLFSCASLLHFNWLNRKF